MQRFVWAYLVVHTFFCVLFPPLVSAFDSVELEENIPLPASLKYPDNLAVDAKGEVLYLLDLKTKTIWQYSKTAAEWKETFKSKDFLTTLGLSRSGLLAYTSEKELFLKKDPLTKTLAQIKGIRKLAWDSSERLWLLTDKLISVDPEGGLQFSFGNFKSASSFAFFWPSDEIILHDEANRKLSVITQNGTPRREIFLPKEIGLNAFCVDEFGWIYLATKEGNILELSPEGAAQGSFGRKGKGFAEFDNPKSISADERGRLWILDAKNKRVSVFAVKNSSKQDPLIANTQARWSFVVHDRHALPDSVNKIISPPKSAQLLFAVGAKAPAIVRQDHRGNLTQLGPWKDEAGATLKLTSLEALVANDDASYIYALEGKKSRILRLDAKNFKVINALGGKGSALKRPKDLLLLGNRLFILEEDRIHIYTPKGIFLNTIGPSIAPRADQKPIIFENLTRIRGWGGGNLFYVVDDSLSKIFIFNQEAKLLDVLGKEPNKKANPDNFGILEDLRDMAIDLYGNLFVLTGQTLEIFEYNKDAYLWISRWILPKNDFPSPKTLSWTLLDKKKNYFAIGDAQKKSLAIVRINYSPKVFLEGISFKDTGGAVQITFAEDSETPTRYSLWRSTSNLISSSESFKEIGVLGSEAINDADFAAEPTTYYYFVQAKSLWSNESSLLVRFASFTPAPSGLTAFTISTWTLANIFSANYKAFGDKAIGSATIVNTKEDVSFRNLKVSFLIKEFMDFPTEQIFDIWPAKQSKELPLYAVFNNKILSVSEDTPIQTELSITFLEGEKERRVAQTKSSMILNRNAISWKNLESLGNFVTPKDPPLIDTVRKNVVAMDNVLEEISQAKESWDPTTLAAWKTWALFASLGLVYSQDPNNPYEKTSEIESAIDYLQFPRETLARKSGDCDDLAVTLATLAEIAGLETAFLDMPGHIIMAINTQIPVSEEEFLLDAPRSWYLVHEDRLWIPLEATLTDAPFDATWRKGAQNASQAKTAGNLRVLVTRDAWQNFKPATLPEVLEKTTLGEVVSSDIQKNWPVKLKEAFLQLRGALEDTLGKDQTARALFALGAIAWRHQDTAKAQERWEKSYQADPKNLSVLNNLANTYILEEKYPEARKLYQEGLSLSANDEDLKHNMAVLNEIQGGKKDVKE